MRSLPVSLLLVLVGCPSEVLLDPSVQIAGALVGADGDETPFEADVPGFVDRCLDDCSFLETSFALDGSEVDSRWVFDSDDLSVSGVFPLVFVNVSWQGSERFARQGDGATSWGERPGGEIVLEETCAECGRAGALDGRAIVTVYEGDAAQPTGELLRVDTLRFTDLASPPGMRLH